MLFNKLQNGDRIPAIGLGTWKSSTQEVYDAVRHALKTGYQHIDCAPIYMNEKPVGQAMKDALKAGELCRESLWVTSKLWNSYHAPEDVMPALKETLHFMQLDYLDAYLIHWPVAAHKRCHYSHVTQAGDYISLDHLPLEVTWEAMLECQKAGLTRHVGVSNCSISKIENLIAKTGVTPSINQVECHPYLNQLALKQYCKKHGICLTAYSPLGSNDRPTQIKSADEPSLLSHPTVLEVAQAQKISTGQVLIAWSLAQGNVVIPKSTNEGRIQENLDAENVSLSDDQLSAINQLNIDFRFVHGRFFGIPGSPYTSETLWG